MPAATTTQAVKSEREERLLEALKVHILKERQRKKKEHEAVVEEERQRKEREAREVKNLGGMRDYIQNLELRLKELNNQKQQLFLQLKKVLNEDENRKKQQQQKDSEIFAVHPIAPPTGPHGQIFLPPRQTTQQILQKGTPGNMGNPPIKRGRSPSPPPPQSYYKSATYSVSPKHEDARRGGDVARVLWNKPTQYQNPPGTLFYQTTSAPPNQQEPRTQSIIYPSYNPNLNIPMRQSYHLELSQPSPAQAHPQKNEQPPKSAQGYHINLEQPAISQASQGQNATAPPPQHKPQVTMEKIPDRGGYHVEVKLDPSQPPTHLPEGVVYTPLMPGIPMHPTVMQMSSSQSQTSKAGGSITPGYPGRGSGHNQSPMSGQPPPSQQIHYPRRLF